MRTIIALLTCCVAACSTGPEHEQPLSIAERSAFLASLSAVDREAFETLIWSREVDPQPIRIAFAKCVDDQFAASTNINEAGAIIDDCFPLVERLVRGYAMEVPALATGPTGDELNDWASLQAAEQKEELKQLLRKRFEARPGKAGG